MGCRFSQGTPTVPVATPASRAKPTTTNSPSSRWMVEVSFRWRMVGPTSSTSPASEGASDVTSTSSSRRTPPASPTVGFTRRSTPTSWRSMFRWVWNVELEVAVALVVETGTGMLLPANSSCSSPESMRRCGRINVVELTRPSFAVRTALVRGTISEPGSPLESTNGSTSGARVKRAA